MPVVAPGSGGGNGGGGNNTGGNTPPPSGNGGGGGGGTGSSGSSGGGAYNYGAEQRKAQRKAAQRYLDQAAALQQQVRALNYSLNKGFEQALEQKLENIGLVLGQQQTILNEGYKDRVGSLKKAASDSDKAELDQSYASLSNRGRERANALSEAAAQGAGESDTLRAQGMALRNWDANQSEVNRNFHDSLTSVNASLTDLNTDTKNAKINLATQANADREQLWTNYYGQRSEAYTQLGNIQGQQAEFYGMANEQVSGIGNSNKRRKAAENKSGNSFMKASKANAMAWENPGVGKKLMEWEGEGPIRAVQNQSRWVNREALSDAPAKRPEGATLREW